MFNHVVTYMADGSSKPLSSVPLPAGFSWKPNDATKLTQIADNQGPFPADYNNPTTGPREALILVDVKPLPTTPITTPRFAPTLIDHVVVYCDPDSTVPLASVPVPNGYRWTNTNVPNLLIGDNQGPFPVVYNGVLTNSVATNGWVWVDVKPTYALITDDHFAYMQGYPGGYFNPDGSMTRAEAAVMFARLMQKQMNVNTPYKGLFNDVPAGEWYTTGVEYLASLGIIQGRDSTWFDPNAPITRGEFASIAAKFARLAPNSSAAFSDVTPSYWAYNAINTAAANGWVTGYPDGTFGPNNYISRVEVVTIVNRMTKRVFDPSEKFSIKTYTDVATSYWGYGDIEEASNSHDFQIKNGIETWTGVTN